MNEWESACSLRERFVNKKFIFGTFQRVILELLRVAMVGNPNTKGFIVDGFPREMEQGKEFENEVSITFYCFRNVYRTQRSSVQSTR